MKLDILYWPDTDLEKAHPKEDHIFFRVRERRVTVSVNSFHEAFAIGSARAINTHSDGYAVCLEGTQTLIDRQGKPIGALYS